MRSAADFIVLSSSPECNAICTLPLGLEDTEKKSLHNASPSPLPSPSEMFRTQIRSRYLTTPDDKRAKTKDRAAEDARGAKATTTNSNPDLLKDKQAEGGKKSTTEPRAELRDLDQAGLKNKQNASTKPKRTRKKQVDSGAGCEQLKNTTITGKVTKSGTAKSKLCPAKTVDGDLISKTIREQSAGKEDKGGCDKDLQLEPAMKRRLDWTPTKQSSKPAIELKDGDGSEGDQNGLGTLLSRYAYDGVATALDKFPLPNNGPTKRRRIELVDSRVLPTKPKPFDDDTAQNSEGDAHVSKSSKPIKRPKTRAKRLTTLTARVTAEYYEESTNCSDSTDQGISITNERSKAANSKSRKSKRKADDNSGFKVPRTIVLSPEDAVKSLDQQDLVFGTCSQLEREDSPTLLRDTQAALQQSEKESLCAPSSRLHQCPGLARPSSAISRLAAPKSLWSVAARDAEGLLVDAKVVNLVDSPEASKVIFPSVEDDKEKDNQRGNASGTSSLGDAPMYGELPASTAQTVEQPTCNKPNTSSKPMPKYNRWTDTSLARKLHSYGLKAIKNRKTMVEVLEKCWIAQQGPATQKEGEDSQSKETTTTTSSASGTSGTSGASELQEAQEKPKKPKATSQRKPKSQLPSQPRTSQPRKENGETTATASESRQTTPTKTKRQQARQSNYPVQTEYSSQRPSTRSFIDVEEIQDSEDELLPSPSKFFDGLFTNRTGKQESKKQKLPTSTSPSSRPTKETTNSNTTATKLPDLGGQITRAVRAQPRQRQSPTRTRKQPTWHEKILIYDPIYLEDFTMWLNTEGLGLVDEDREVGAGFVRQWCESKGICCCYKMKKTVGHF
ncbi:hypothetical protein BJX76DRAFT_9695 [Aspergillus varians]